MTGASDGIVLPAGWPVRTRLETLARTRKVLFLAGLPGVGKSLLVQQLVRMAARAGRRVSLLQWDVARAAFETPEILARYPEIDGFTHAALKLAVGLWARDAVAAWHRANPGPEALLVAESALIGSRLIELARPADDLAEPLLAGPDTTFLIPVPTVEVRALIERARETTIRAPRHAREGNDAPPNVLRALWREVWRESGGRDTIDDPPYDPDAYAAVFRRWLGARRTETLSIDRVIDAGGSVYDLGVPAADLVADPPAVARILERVDAQFRPERK